MSDENKIINDDIKEEKEKEDIENDTSKAEEEVQEAIEKVVEMAEGKKDDKAKKKKHKKDFKKEFEEINDKYQRLFAEFQNFRSRNEKEKVSMYEMGERTIIEKILPIVDNFERGIDALSEEDLDSPVGSGMNLIYKQLTDTLTDMGVTVIETEGKEFDPELHNAVMHEDNEEYGENVIIEELQKGYMFNDTVIRHSLVKVAN